MVGAASVALMGVTVLLGLGLAWVAISPLAMCIALNVETGVMPTLTTTFVLRAMDLGVGLAWRGMAAGLALLVIGTTLQTIVRETILRFRLTGIAKQLPSMVSVSLFVIAVVAIIAATLTSADRIFQLHGIRPRGAGYLALWGVLKLPEIVLLAVLTPYSKGGPR